MPLKFSSLCRASSVQKPALLGHFIDIQFRSVWPLPHDRAGRANRHFNLDSKIEKMLNSDELIDDNMGECRI